MVILHYTLLYQKVILLVWIGDLFMSILIELLYPLQYGNTPLHLAVLEDHTTCVERLLSTSDIDINIKNEVGWCNECHE